MILQYVQRDTRRYKPNLSLCRVGISVHHRFSATPGSERTVPGRVPFHAPRSPSRSSAPVRSPAPQRAAVWGGRGATARPRQPKWSSGVATVCWVYYNERKTKITTTTEHHYKISIMHTSYLLVYAESKRCTRSDTRQNLVSGTDPYRLYKM